MSANAPQPNPVIAIHWFRQDLRIDDNPALNEAIANGQLLPIFILDEDSDGAIGLGAASRCWLHQALIDLNAQLQGRLRLYKGNAESILEQLCRNHKVASVHWNRCYEPWRINRDTRIKHLLQQQCIEVNSHNGSLLWEPWQILKQDQTPYKVYTPYYRRGCLLNGPPPRPALALTEPVVFADGQFEAMTLDALNLLPEHTWHEEMLSHWQVSAAAAHQQLETFLQDSVMEYKDGRDFPARRSVSSLSPYLHWGQISPHQIWQRLLQLESDDNLEHFKSELGWREFSYYQLYHFPQLPQENLQPKFDHFPWQQHSPSIQRWERGQTGYPLVDAGMRELWQTGTMHNRVRMVVASFLVKNLNIHWHRGAEWFWDCLVDADLASNSANWQWVAGCGMDAAPYFRIFNPTTQGTKFDKHGDYTRHYVPELKNVPDKYLFRPWEAPETVLFEAGVTLGEDYPTPIVDLAESRNNALTAYRQLSEQHAQPR